MPVDQAKIDAIKSRFRLSYQIDAALMAGQLAGLQGKRVLEVGGSLPQEFVLDAMKASSWLGLEEEAYYSDSGVRPPAMGNALPLSEIALPLAPYQIACGRIEDLPERLYGLFDVVFSVAAFEHIADLSLALQRMHDALVPGGFLVSVFSPIWSAYNGHHLHPVTDGKGVTFSFEDSGIPAFGHLLMSPEALRLHMLELTDEATAARIVHQVYHTPAINRLFAEDYIDLVRRSPFKTLLLEPTFPSKVDSATQVALEARFPGKKLFAYNGMRLVLQK